MAAFDLLKAWIGALSATAMLILGAELFLLHSTYHLVKLLSLALMTTGILVLGGTRWRAREVWGKLVALLLFSGYLLGASYRYPGLLKEPKPYRMSDLLGFGVKTFLFGVAVTLAVGAARWLAFSIAKKGPEGLGPSE